MTAKIAGSLILTILGALALVLVLLSVVAHAQPATSPLPMPVTCVQNKSECPRGSWRGVRSLLPDPPSGVDVNGRPYNHRGFVAYITDCESTTSCASGGGTTACALRGSDDGLVWEIAVCGGTGGGGSGAPTDVLYWVGNGTNVTGLSAEKLLGALSTGLVINTGGNPSAYTGTTCAVGSSIRALNTSGAATSCTLAGIAVQEDGALVASGQLTLNVGAGLDVSYSGTTATVVVDPSELGGIGAPPAAGYHPFGSPGTSTIAAPAADFCTAWQASSPFSGNNAFIGAMEITTADANDQVKLGIYTSSGGARVFNGAVTVNATARVTVTNADAFQAWTATDHWFVICCDSPDASCTTRFRSAGGAQLYGKQITFANPDTSGADLPTAINSFIGADPWTTNSEPPALYVRLE